MPFRFQKHDLRPTIRKRIGALGALGVFGLALVGCIYLAGQHAEAPLQQRFDDAEWTYHRFSEMNASLMAARRSESAFLLQPNKALATLHRTKVASAEADLAKIADQPGFSEPARVTARAFTSAARTWTTRTLAVVAHQELLGFDRESGLRASLRDTGWRLEGAVAGIGDQNLTAALLALQVLQTDAVDWGHPQSRASLAAELSNIEVAVNLLPDPTERSALAGLLSDFSDELASCLEARANLDEQIDKAEQAFVDADTAGMAASTLANAESAQQQAELSAVRHRTSQAMRWAILLVTLAVGALARRISRDIAGPLTGVAALTRQLAAGDVGLNIRYTQRGDEIGDVARALAVFRDTIEMNRLASERIYRLAHHDALTGLANRTLLQDRLSEAISLARRTSSSVIVLCLDLDGFKAINDLHGHAAGDQLLREVAARLAGNIRETDTAARFGGDEFVIVQSCGDDPAAAAHALAERLLALLSVPYDLSSDGLQGLITASVGAALFPGDGASPAELLRNADTALYRSKAAGRNCASFFQPEMDRDLRRRRAIESDVQHAIARGELELAWQPLVEATEERKVAGFEVLLRWQPENGPVSPDVFIPVAETCGAIHAIGEWVLRQACTEAARWGEPLEVAVNVSPVQVQTGDAFAEMVEDALAISGLPPSRLTLEVTEGVLIRDADRVLAALRRLKSLGIRVALDDFGTGYSSLATLRAFPFDKIKIDRSFTSGLTDNGQDAAIVRAVIGLARGLGLPVVAEGVETEAQLLVLQNERCAEVQGWLLGRPAPISSFTALLGTKSPGSRRAAQAVA